VRACVHTTSVFFCVPKAALRKEKSRPSKNLQKIDLSIVIVSILFWIYIYVTDYQQATLEANKMSFTISTIATTPFEGQQTGTSGLRKKVSVVRQANYIENWLESLFQSVKNDGLAGNIDICCERESVLKLVSCAAEHSTGSTLIVGGDGRYWNR
jgi:hypothetical protein